MAFDWLKIKTDYFTSPMNTSLEVIARKYKVNATYIYEVAAKEGWIKEKQEIWKKSEDKLIERLPETLANIKLRHAKYARFAQAKAIAIIKQDKAVSKSTYADLKAAVDMERDALGLNDKKQADEVYEKFSQFNFIFSLKKDELQRFIESALGGRQVESGNNGTAILSETGKAREGEIVDSPKVSE